MNRLPRPGVWRRAAPFLVFMALLALRGLVPEGSAVDARWLYALQIAVPAALLWFWRAEYGELARQNWPNLRELMLAAAVGLAVFALWIRLDATWMQIGNATASFVPLDAQGRLDAPLIALRAAGAVLLVPLMEEVFWRSFLMRWVQQPRFEGLDPRRIGPRAIIVSTFVFTLAHPLWLAAAIAGLAYALLYVRSGKLWVAVVSHAVTNAALGIWVVATASWQFW